MHRGSNCSLARAMDGHIMRCGIISSCQSAAISKIVKRSWACVHRGAAVCQVPDLYLIYLTQHFNNICSHNKYQAMRPLPRQLQETAFMCWHLPALALGPKFLFKVFAKPKTKLEPKAFALSSKRKPNCAICAKLHYTDTGYVHVVQHHQWTSSQQFYNLLYNKFTTNG